MPLLELNALMWEIEPYPTTNQPHEQASSRPCRILISSPNPSAALKIYPTILAVSELLDSWGDSTSHLEPSGVFADSQWTASGWKAKQVPRSQYISPPFTPLPHMRGLSSKINETHFWITHPEKAIYHSNQVGDWLSARQNALLLRNV